MASYLEDWPGVERAAFDGPAKPGAVLRSPSRSPGHADATPGSDTDDDVDCKYQEDLARVHARSAAGSNDGLTIAFAFGPFKFRPERQTLCRDGRPIKLGSRAMDILHFMMAHAGKPVTRDEIIDHVWPKTFVSESNLRVQIRNLRRALGDERGVPTYIATVTGRGYQFVAPVSAVSERLSDHTLAAEPAAASMPAFDLPVGCEAELARVALTLESSRLVTLVGPAGSCKAAFARAVGQLISRSFPGGVHHVDLAGIESPGFVACAIARALGVDFRIADLEAAIVSALGHRRTLVVVENCELLAGAVSALSRRIIMGCASSALLATSQMPLHAREEVVLRIGQTEGPVSSEPVNSDHQRTYSALQLFATRAERLTQCQMKTEEIAVISHLCQSVVGLPLVIEILAAKLAQASSE